MADTKMAEPPMPARRVTMLGSRHADVTQTVLANMLRSEAIGREVVFAGVADPRVPRSAGTEEQMRRRLYQAVRDAHPHTIADLQRPRTCVQCRRQYVERDNIGQWECARHPGTIEMVWGASNEAYLPSSRLGVWSCCGKRDWAKGCTPCDHTDVPNGGDQCIVATVPRYLQLPDTGALIAAGPLSEREASRCVRHPARDAVVASVHEQWLNPDIRNPQDLRGLTEERYYQEELVGAAQPPLLVMRMDYWNRRPKIQELY